MDNWFTVTEIDKITYAISEYANPQQVHSYLIIGKTHAALMDSGMGVKNIKSVVDSLTDLPVKVLTSHVHFDHTGGHKYYEEIYVHKKEADWLRNGGPMSLEDIKEYINEDPINMPLPADFDLESYKPYQGEPSGLLEDGDTIDLGGRELNIIHTPGHSPGHICIWEEKTGYLFTGDLIYNAELYACFDYSDPKLYSRSLEKVSGMKEIKKFLPGHCDLDIGLELLADMVKAFKELEKEGVLRLGAGTFEYEDFMIVL